MRCWCRALDEEDGDQDHADEDQDRDGRAEPEVHPVDEDVVARIDALGAESAARLNDEDVVEYSERVERPEQQRDEDRRLHQRQRDAEEALQRARAVYLGRLVQLVRNQRQASASSSSAMNGVVFHISARMITKSEPSFVVSGASRRAQRQAEDEAARRVEGERHANAATTVTIP